MEKTHGYYIPTPKEPHEMNSEELAEHLRDVQPETIKKALEIKAELKAQKQKELLQRQKQHDTQVKEQSTPMYRFIEQFGLREKLTKKIKESIKTEKWSIETLREIRTRIMTDPQINSMHNWDRGRKNYAIQYLNAVISDMPEHKTPFETIKEFVTKPRGF